MATSTTLLARKPEQAGGGRTTKLGGRNKLSALRKRDAITKNSSPTECPEDALICVRWVGIVGEVRLILIRSRENRQHLGKR